MSEPTVEPPPDDPWIGRVLDERYRIDGVVGAGGLGLVYRATHMSIDRVVAVKILQHEMIGDEGLRKRFEREVRILSRLAHPHIVTIVDSGVVDESATYLVMELLSGTTLEERLDEEGLLRLPEALTICRQILLGLAEAHDQGVLHRDIKPANVFLQPLADGTHVKLLDFGLAKPERPSASGKGSTLTGSGIAIGTPSYMSPEQASLDAVTAASDLYAVGIVLFEMLTGAPPFEGETKLEILRGHLERPVPELDEASEGFEPPEELRAFVRTALAKEPAARFGSAQEMLAALDGVPVEPVAAGAPRERPAEGETVELGSSELDALEADAEDREADDPSLEIERAAPPPRRRIRWPWGLALLAIAGTAGGWWWWRESHAPADAPEPIVADDGVQALEEDLSRTRGVGAENPFSASSLPTQLRAARRRVVRGRVLDAGMVRDVTRFQRAHPDDPRPALLLARHHRLRGRYVPMVHHYADAYARDASAAAFDPMLPDLVRASRDADAHGAAVRALQEAFGRRALPEIEAQLAGPLGADDRRRLEEAQRRLAGDQR